MKVESYKSFAISLKKSDSFLSLIISELLIIISHSCFNFYVIKSKGLGVPVVAQWLGNPTRNYEVAGLVPGLAQWVGDPALP